jgi:Flp pilus assembly secretin CpaC
MRCLPRPLAAYLLLSGVALLRAETPKPLPAVPKANVFIELQMVVIPQETATPLITELLDPKQIDGAAEKIQALIANGKARLVGWPMLTAHSGERASFDAIREIRYATQYTEAEMNVYYPELRHETKDNTSDQKSAKPDLSERKNALTAVELTATPDRFATGKAGITLDVMPVISADGKTIKLDIVPQHMRLKAMNKVAIKSGDKEPKDEGIVMEQPEFDTVKNTTTFTLRDGERRLLSVFRTSDPSDEVELFIIRTEVEHLQ